MITIDGEEGIPVQVDGEAWVQRPGLIKIRYKNAAQMLTRDRVRKESLTFLLPCLTLLDSGLQMLVYSRMSQRTYLQMQYPGTTHPHSDSLSLV